jgi:ribose transport system substrate-binding protein
MKKTSLLILALFVTGLYQGCDDKSSQMAKAPAEVPKQSKLRLAFVANNANYYWAMVRLGCDSAVRELGDVDLEFRTAVERTAAAQQEVMTNLVASGVDGMAISPIDAESQTEFLNSIATNVLLICTDSDAEKSKRACYIGSDNVTAGTQAAELLKAALPHGGKIALFVGNLNAQNAKERIQGIQNGLVGSNIQIIDTLANEGKSTLAQKNAEDELAKYPDLAGMVGLYSYHGPAILTAVRSAGKVGQVKIVCFDEDSETLAGVAAGEIYGTVVQKPFAIGRQTIIRMGKYLRGDKAQLAAGKIFIPTQAITKDNVALLQNTLKYALEE